MTEPVAEPEEQLPDPSIGGVSLSRYAAVGALVVEGIPLDDALGACGIAPDAWPAVDDAWRDALAADASRDGELTAARDQFAQRASERVERRLPPLDEDWRAWVQFIRAFSAQPDPLAFLDANQMTPSDIFRLQRHWQTRLAADEALREPFARAFSEPAEFPPDVRPEPPKLRS